MLVYRCLCDLRCARVGVRYAARPALLPHAPRDPRNPARATLSRSAGACVESASLMKDRRVVLGAALALIGLPVVIVPIEAVSFYATNRDNGSFVSSGEERQYLLYVPRSYDRSKPTPLVIS